MGTPKDTPSEIRYMHNKIHKNAKEGRKQRKEIITALKSINNNIVDGFDQIAEEIRLYKQAVVLCRLSEMTKIQRKNFIKIQKIIQKEDIFINTYGEGEDILNMKKIEGAM